MRAPSDLGTVFKPNLALVAHTKLKTRMERNRLARQLFAMLKIRKDHILFELCLWKEKEEEERKQEGEQN